MQLVTWLWSCLGWNRSPSSCMLYMTGREILYFQQMSFHCSVGETNNKRLNAIWDLLTKSACVNNFWMYSDLTNFSLRIASFISFCDTNPLTIYVAFLVLPWHQLFLHCIQHGTFYSFVEFILWSSLNWLWKRILSGLTCKPEWSWPICWQFLPWDLLPILICW